MLQVTGRGGVPQGAAAAVLNVTVTEPTDESFVTVWPADAATVPDAANDAVRQIEIAGETPRVTASFGVHAASCLHPLSEVLRKADAALFTAKARGRNLVHTYQRAPRRGATASELDQPRAAELEEEHER